MSLAKTVQQQKADPVEFVSRNLGEIRGKSLLSTARFLLVTEQGDSPLFRRIVRDLVKSQRADGGFQRRTRGESSSILETAHLVRFLLAAGLARNSKLMKNATRFLINNQRPDGGFSELEGTYHRDQWAEKWVYVKRVSSPFITSAVIRALLDSGMESDSAPIRSGLRFLREAQKSDGGWELYRSSPESDPYITAAIISELARFKVFREKVRFRDAISFVLRFRKHSGSFGDCFDATISTVDALAEAGYDSRDRVIASAIGWILKHQGSDGSLYDRDCEGQPVESESAIRATINGIITLSKLDALRMFRDSTGGSQKSSRKD